MSIINDKTWYLKKVNILSSLNENEISYIAKNCTMKTYTKNEIIYNPGDKGNLIYFIKKGKIRIFKNSPKWKEITLTILKEGECFGSLYMEEKQEYKEFADSFSDNSMVCLIPKTMFFSLTKNNSSIPLKINKLLGLRIYELEMMIEELTFKSVIERIASVLSKLINKYGNFENENAGTINLPITHYDLAKMIGVTREAASNALMKLKKMNIIELKRKKILVNDYNELKELGQK